jgi:type II secretion system protein J
MLVAMTVFTLIAGAIYSLLSSSRMLTERAAFHGRMDQAGRSALRALEADLRGAWGTAEISTLDTGFVGASSGTVDEPEDTLTFISLGNMPKTATPTSSTETVSLEMDLSKVSWSIDKDDSTDAKGLVRSKRKLITEVQGVTKKGDDLETIVEEVTGLRFKYYDGSGWVETWDSTSTGTLPRAVEVTITLTMEFRGETETESYSTRVYLPVAARVPKKKDPPQ